LLVDGGGKVKDHGSTPVLDHGVSPKRDTGTPPKLDTGTSPKRDTGTPPKLDTGTPGAVTPPLGGSSKGSGGSTPVSGSTFSTGGVSFNLIVPGSYAASKANALMIVFSGTEGVSVMTMNLKGAGPAMGLGDLIFAVLDGKATYGNGGAGAKVLDWARSHYNIDNDRTFLLSESAGTKAGLQLGFQLRQSYFGAYWANDVNTTLTPSKTAAQLGFAPWGNAGPGGQVPTAQAIVNSMKSAGYRLPADAPYSGSGSTKHGDPNQFMAALKFFVGKSRR